MKKLIVLLTILLNTFTVFSQEKERLETEIETLKAPFYIEGDLAINMNLFTPNIGYYLSSGFAFNKNIALGFAYGNHNFGGQHDGKGFQSIALQGRFAYKRIIGKISGGMMWDYGINSIDGTYFFDEKRAFYYQFSTAYRFWKVFSIGLAYNSSVPLAYRYEGYEVSDFDGRRKTNLQYFALTLGISLGQPY